MPWQNPQHLLTAEADFKCCTCEEGGGTFQNFCLAIIDKLEKQLFIKKLLNWGNKPYNCWRYHHSSLYTCVPKTKII